MLAVQIYLLQPAMVLFLAAATFAADEPVNSANVAHGVLVGQFKKNGKTPLANGRLFIFNKAMGPPSSDKFVRAPDEMVSLDKNGTFSLKLAGGTYYLCAVRMPDPGTMGPPEEGELIYFKMDAKGEIKPFIVSAGSKTNAGKI